MKLTGGILGWGGERLGGVHGSLVGYVIPSIYATIDVCLDETFQTRLHYYRNEESIPTMVLKRE